MRFYRFSRRLVTMVACVALALPGCTSQIQRIGADDGSDVCRPQRVTLDSTGNFFAEDIIKGAAIGAVIGGLSGLLLGQNPRGALIGAATGGALGAAGGYLRARQQQASDQASLYRTISSDVQRENDFIDKTQLALDQLVDCRRSEASRVRADLRAGRISRDQAQAAMAAVRERSAGDLRIAQNISGKMQERSKDFASANDQLALDAPPTSGGSTYSGEAPYGDTWSPLRPARQAGSTTRSPAAPAREVQVATATNVAKVNKFAQSVTSVAAAQTSSFELPS